MAGLHIKLHLLVLEVTDFMSTFYFLYSPGLYCFSGHEVINGYRELGFCFVFFKEADSFVSELVIRITNLIKV